MAWAHGAPRTSVVRSKLASGAPSRRTSSQFPRGRRGCPARPGTPIRAPSRSSTNHHRPASPAHRNSAYPWHDSLPSPPRGAAAPLDMLEESMGSPPPTPRSDDVAPDARQRTHARVVGFERTLNASGRLGRARSSSAGRRCQTLGGRGLSSGYAGQPSISSDGSRGATGRTAPCQGGPGGTSSGRRESCGAPGHRPLRRR
jgi:hypothetical protein